MQIDYVSVKLMSVYKNSNGSYDIRVEMPDYYNPVVSFQQNYWPEALQPYLSVSIDAPIYVTLELDKTASKYIKLESRITILNEDKNYISMKKYHHIEVTGFTSGLGYFKVTYYPEKGNLVVESNSFSSKLE